MRKSVAILGGLSGLVGLVFWIVQPDGKSQSANAEPYCESSSIDANELAAANCTGGASPPSKTEEQLPKEQDVPPGVRIAPPANAVPMTEEEMAEHFACGCLDDTP